MPLLFFWELGRISIEFVNVGGWLTSGDIALESGAKFLAVTEHRLIPARTRSIGHHLRKAGRQSGRLLARIRSLVILLGLGLLACTVLP